MSQAEVETAARDGLPGGLGVPPDIPTWGNMLTNSETYALQSPYLVIVPGLVLTVAILAINFLGDGIRDALDPLQG